MSEPSLEDRVARLEDHARRPHWLDEPAIINGEQVVLLDHFPLGVKIIFGLMIAMGVFVIGALVYGRISGAIA